MGDHISSLRELGFIKLGLPLIAPGSDKKPWFWNRNNESDTIAITATGECWWSDGAVDLLPFDFEDRSAKMNDVVSAGGLDHFKPKN